MSECKDLLGHLLELQLLILSDVVLLVLGGQKRRLPYCPCGRAGCCSSPWTCPIGTWNPLLHDLKIYNTKRYIKSVSMMMSLMPLDFTQEKFIFSFSCGALWPAFCLPQHIALQGVAVQQRSVEIKLCFPLFSLPRGLASVSIHSTSCNRRLARGPSSSYRRPLFNLGEI